jgi:hypothetical protein
MTTIDYDKPVADYIDRLSATGHVTHSTWNKTSVTFHHNGGVGVSFDQILETWTTREASAHFDVDAKGNVAQFVKVDEYAWAVGDTAGNESTISIEMTDQTGAPNWVVADVTWKSAARLAAWLFVHVIGAAPTAENIFPHRHWSSTDCPGPFVMSHFNDIVAEVQAQYAILKGESPTPAPAPSPSPASDKLDEDGKLGPLTITRWQEIMRTPVDGVISTPSSILVAEVQKLLNRKINANLKVDGYGIVQNGQPYDTVGALQKYLGTPYDRRLSTPISECIKAVQRRLNAGWF